MSEEFFDLEKPIDQVTMTELDRLGTAIFNQRKLCDEEERLLDKKKELLANLQAQMLAILNRLGRSNYTIPGVGQLIKSERTSVKLPGSPEAREEFFEYLKEKGIFEDLLTINSNTLNAFYKKEFEIAAEEGRAVDFKIPGIGEPAVFTTLKMSKGK